MTTLLPQDSNGHPIPALRIKSGGSHTISIGSTSTCNSTAFDDDTQIISLYSDVPAYIAFGDENVTATSGDHYLPADLYYDISIGGNNSVHHTHIAALQVSDTGTLYISEKE